MLGPSVQCRPSKGALSLPSLTPGSTSAVNKLMLTCRTASSSHLNLVTAALSGLSYRLPRLRCGGICRRGNHVINGMQHLSMATRELNSHSFTGAILVGKFSRRNRHQPRSSMAAWLVALCGVMTVTKPHIFSGCRLVGKFSRRNRHLHHSSTPVLVQSCAVMMVLKRSTSLCHRQ